MAKISKITALDGTVYELKDAGVPEWARNSSKPAYTPGEVGIKHIIATLGSYVNSTSNAWENTGLTITVPTGHIYIGLLSGSWISGKPIGIGINPSNTLTGNEPDQAHQNNNEAAFSFTVTLYPGTWYVYTKRVSAAVNANNYYFRYFDVQYS